MPVVACLASMHADLDKHPVAHGADAPSVPVIDAAHLGDEHARGDCVAAIADACRHWGFFQLVNHGVGDALTAAVWRQTQWFFAQSDAVKASVLRTLDNPWGYYRNELTKNQRDKKEVFDFTSEGVDPIYSGQNRWPVGYAEFRSVLLRYFDACTDLAHRLLAVFCEGLGLAGDTLAGQFGAQHTGFVRLNYYPVNDPLDATMQDSTPVADMGVHHHTDAGGLTILLQDHIGGLQVHRDGRWYPVEPLAGGLVINTGDMMQVWSNDHYVAAMHRVLAMDSEDRYSVPFFFNPRADAVVVPLTHGAGGHGAPRYRPVNWAAFRGQRTAGDYADYGDEVQIEQFRKATR